MLRVFSLAEPKDGLPAVTGLRGHLGDRAVGSVPWMPKLDQEPEHCSGGEVMAENVPSWGVSSPPGVWWS